MLERVFDLTVQETYKKIRTALAEAKCSNIIEDPPKQIVAMQGSLWGISPQTAKKIVKIDLEPENNVTKIVCISKLSSDWKNVTLIGCLMTIILIVLCLWMAIDLNGFILTNNPSFWSWLVDGAYVNVLAGRALINLSWGISAFLFIVLVLEAAIVIYAKSKIDSFAEIILHTLS